jgi:hypothetical protein
LTPRKGREREGKERKSGGTRREQGMGKIEENMREGQE